MEIASPSCQEVVKLSSGMLSLWKVTGIFCEQGSEGITPELVEPFPQLCSEANDFFKVTFRSTLFFKWL